MYTPRALVVAPLLALWFGSVTHADDFVVNDVEQFAQLIPEGARLEKLAGDMKFTEGPVWVPGDNGGMLLFSDIPADEIKKWTLADGLSVFRAMSRGANGNTLDAEGRLITCEHRSRSVVRNSPDGSMETLAESFNGRKLNSPNDAAVKSDGSIWFTDPPYGLGNRHKEQRGNYVFRLEAGKEPQAVIQDIAWPNGICFAPDESKLYVANSDATNPVIYAAPFKPDGTVGTPQPLCRIDKGIPDGIRCDAEGRVWSSAGDGVHVFTSGGKLIGKVLVPESPANLCFGGADGKTLLITARTSLYAIKTNVRAPGSPVKQEAKPDEPAPSAQGNAPLRTGDFRWTVSPPLVAPVERPQDPCFSMKDPTVVRHNDQWHLFCTIRSEKRSHQIEYLSFSDWKEADASPRHVLKISDGYYCAPQVFWFEPHRRWYMILQTSDPSRKVQLQPAFSTTENIADPESWSKPVLLFKEKHPETVSAWIDFWVICDDQKAHLFFTSNNGLMWRAETTLANFPHDWTEPYVVLSGDIFEASCTYKLKGRSDYLSIVEAQTNRPGGWRYYKAYLADSLDGEWKPLADKWDKPFAGPGNITFAGEKWTDSISHGELLRTGYDQTLEVDPQNLRFLFQGVLEKDRAGKPYGRIPWQLGMLDMPLPHRSSAPSPTVAPATEIIAHRGASADAPENTAAAFKLGFEQGADSGEIDIHVSKDGHLVVIHDADTKRTAGVEGTVAQRTLEELRALDVGAFDAWAGKGFSEKIPTLDEILALVPAGKKVFIEIKSRVETLPPLEQALHRAKFAPGQTVIITFHYEVAEAAKKRFPEIEVYWLHGYSKDKSTGQYPDLEQVIDRAQRAAVDGVNLHHDFPLDGAAIARVRAAGLKLYVWTVDDPQKARHLAAAGIDGITTNRPGALRREIAAGAEQAVK